MESADQGRKPATAGRHTVLKLPYHEQAEHEFYRVLLKLFGPKGGFGKFKNFPYLALMYAGRRAITRYVLTATDGNVLAASRACNIDRQRIDFQIESCQLEHLKRRNIQKAIKGENNA